MAVGRCPEIVEKKRKKFLIIRFAEITGVISIALGLINIYQGHLTVGLVCILFSAACMLFRLFSHRSLNIDAFSLYLAIAIFLFGEFLIVHGGASGAGMLWMYLVNIIVVLLVGPFYGVIYAIFFLGFNFLLLYGSWGFVFEYPNQLASRFLISNLGVVALMITAERLRLNSHDLISDTVSANLNLALTDNLTKLMNRTGLEIALAEQVAANKNHAVLALIDVDHFKSVNDTYGHDFGDKVLIGLADLIVARTRNTDLRVRWGGEEFLLVLFNMSQVNASCLINKLRMEFSKHTFPTKTGHYQGTFSAGLAELNSNSDFELTLKMADDNLYKAKSMGRNKVVASSENIT